MVPSPELLARLRTEGDPELDFLVERLFRDRQAEAVLTALRGWTRNGQPVPAAVPADLAAALGRIARLPEGVDRERMARASALFVDHGMTIGTLLGLVSLLECYTATLGVKSLHATDRMGRGDAARRVGETAQFVVHVMQKGGLFEGGTGLPVIAKVRLMHAASRQLLQLGGWDEAKYGVPICQEDLLATLLTFGHSPLRHFPKLGIEISDQDREDFLYFWNVVAHPLGVRADVLPSDVKEAGEIFRRICARQQGSSPEGIELTAALLSTYADLVPGTLFDGVVPALARWLAGDEVCDLLDVPRTRWTAVLSASSVVFRVWNGAQRESTTLNALVNKLGFATLTRLSLGFTGGRGADFDLPKELRRAWKVPAARGAVRARDSLRENTQAILAREPSAARGLSTVLDVLLVVATADGIVDDLEAESIVDLLVASTGGALREDGARGLIGPSLAELASRRGDVVRRAGRALSAAGSGREGIAMAVAMAYASSGVSDVERHAALDLAIAAEVDDGEAIVAGEMARFDAP